jgi:RNA polymerase sigma factor (sigma-70 family)
MSEAAVQQADIAEVDTLPAEASDADLWIGQRIIECKDDPAIDHSRLLMTAQEADLAARHYYLIDKTMRSATLAGLLIVESYNAEVRSKLGERLCRLAIKYDPDIGSFANYAAIGLGRATIDALRAVSAQEGRSRLQLAKYKAAQLLEEASGGAVVASDNILPRVLSLDLVNDFTEDGSQAGLTDTIVSDTVTVEDLVIGDDTAAELRTILENLPSGFKDILLAYLQGSKQKDLAITYGVTESRISQIVRQARGLIKQEYESINASHTTDARLATVVMDRLESQMGEILHVSDDLVAYLANYYDHPIEQIRRVIQLLRDHKQVQVHRSGHDDSTITGLRLVSRQPLPLPRQRGRRKKR